MSSVSRWFVVASIASALVLSSLSSAQPALAKGPKAPQTVILCVADVVVETRDQSGTVLSTEAYHKDFSMTDGTFFSDDFSTFTRFKFFDAAMTTNLGASKVSIDWFADVTVFNAVDVSTSVTIPKGQKEGSTSGIHTFYTSTGSTQTTYSLTCLKM